jgi:GT2 family glycosyltransferase
LFLNPDVVCPPAALQRLVDALDSRPDAWGATPWFRFPDGTAPYFWRRLVGGFVTALCFTRWGKRVDALVGHPAWRRRCYRDLPDPPGRMDIDGVGAACLLVRRSDFVASGGFDEQYFNFFQDGHLERRLQRQGRALLGVGDVEVSHVVGSTLVQLPAWQVDAQMLGALRQFTRGEPLARRLLVMGAIHLDLWLPHPHRTARRRAVLRPDTWPAERHDHAH